MQAGALCMDKVPAKQREQAFFTNHPLQTRAISLTVSLIAHGVSLLTLQDKVSTAKAVPHIQSSLHHTLAIAAKLMPEYGEQYTC